jgi:serine/threonine protein kinase/ankyrin repeat protein
MMKDWEKIDQLFHQALECPNNEERAQFIERAAQGDPALRDELQALLDAHEENRSFLETPVVRVSLSPQFGHWQSQIVQSLAPPSGDQMMAGQMIGRLLDGKYRLEELCGRGGMGTVYRALHAGTGRRVAVKVIAPELAGNREFIERFRREAKTIGRLRHPNIVNVTDFGITGENERTLAYLVMEHLEGCTLATKLKDGRPLPLADALDILSQTCAAIDEAHRLGILHRDLKPENIWLEPVGVGGCNVKVLDFGIAQLREKLRDQMHDIIALDEPEPLPVISEENLATTAPRQQPLSITEDETLPLNFTLQQLTRSGTVLGTPKYMSPEQCRGEKLDNASDIYSLGVIAYQMLSGELPFKGTVAELLEQHREAAPVPLSRKRVNLPATLDTVINQALAKDPSARPATAGAFAFLLGLKSTGNDWLRRRADDINRRDRFKLTALAVRVQWRSWLLIGSILMATVKLPGLRPLQAVLVFGSLWLLISAITLWKQNSTTAAFSLFLEQTRKVAKTEIGARTIAKAVRQRRWTLARATWAELAGLARKLFSFKLVEVKRWADSLLIVPPVVQEGLSVAQAAQRSADLVAPLRRKLTYPFLRRLLAFGLVLTAWQIMLVICGDTLHHSGGRRLELAEAIIFRFPLILALCFTAFSLSLKSSIEQAVLYLTARQSLGEITAETAGLPYRQEVETRQHSLWLGFKTYAPTCALLLLMAYLQFHKYSLMTVVINSDQIYTVKALQATGVPLPFWSLPPAPPSGFRRWLHRAVLPFGRHSFQPYGPQIIRSYAMTEFLLEKGVDVNRRIVLGGDWTPPRIGDVSMTPLHIALTDGRVDIAQLMIAHGADVHARDSIGRTPLTTAIMHCPTAIDLLLASGADINEQTRFGPPLLAAARYQWLYPYRWNKRMQERENVVKYLLEKGADPNTRDSEGRNALMVMSMESRSIGDFRYGVRPRQRIPPPPDRVVELEFEALDDRVKQVYEKASQPDRALQLIGEALLQAGCDINASDSNGRTPLMYAVRYSRTTAVRLLLKGGANVKTRDKNGMTALDLAKHLDNREIDQEIIRLLYQSAGIRPKTITANGASGG